MKKDDRIFIVDDDQFWTSMLEQLLKSIGYTNIHCFSNGKEAIQQVHLNPKLVFLDYEMQEINGLEVLQQIKSYFPGIGVIFCTAHEDLNLAINAMKYGSFDYLLKQNVNRKEIMDIIANMQEKQLFTKVY